MAHGDIDNLQQEEELTTIVDSFFKPRGFKQLFGMHSPDMDNYSHSPIIHVLRYGGLLSILNPLIRDQWCFVARQRLDELGITIWHNRYTPLPIALVTEELSKEFAKYYEGRTNKKCYME